MVRAGVGTTTQRGCIITSDIYIPNHCYPSLSSTRRSQIKYDAPEMADRLRRLVPRNSKTIRIEINVSIKIIELTFTSADLSSQYLYIHGCKNDVRQKP